MMRTIKVNKARVRSTWHIANTLAHDWPQHVNRKIWAEGASFEQLSHIENHSVEMGKAFNKNPQASMFTRIADIWFVPQI